MDKPNFLLINCDDMGYGDLGCYGSNKNHTPCIDKLAEDGIRFTSFYAASPVCSPSRASLMTGCYPPRIGLNKVLFPGNPHGLAKDEYTMGNLFKDNGYGTMIIGKWHCGDQPESLPTRFGFDDYYGLPYSNDMGIQKNKNGKNPYAMPPLPLLRGEEVVEEQPDQRGLTERYVEKGIEFIRKNKDKPFFLYFAQMHVHLPLYAANTFVEKSENGDYGACVEEVDWSVSAIISELKRLGKYENTIIIFTSDNGSKSMYGASNAPLYGNKFTTWEGGLRVPFIISWPGHIKPGQVCDSIGCNIDLLPTFASIIGAKLPGNKIDGVDISSILFENVKSKPRNIMLYFAPGNNMDEAYLNAVRNGKWKLHVAYPAQFAKKDAENNRSHDYPALFNLEEDIAEEHNVLDDHLDVVGKIMRKLKAFRYIYGDANTGEKGAQVRSCNIAENPKPLTSYDENHPYIVAMYDKEERG